MQALYLLIELCVLYVLQVISFCFSAVISDDENTYITRRPEPA
jgi:hypothetical protein